MTNAELPVAERHIPVMAAETLACIARGLSPAAGDAASGAAENALAGRKIIDGTFGNGGYSRLFLARGAQVLGLDRDPQAAAEGQRLAAASGGQFTMAQTEFSRLDVAAQEAGFAPADAVALDIGVSSMQIDDGARGFSFMKDGPLDMRMAGRGASAASAVNHLKPKDLARIFHFYGEERHAGRIARMIEARRAEKPFATTLDLANAISALGLHRQEKIHAATRVFQALRIYVNDELGELARALFAAERVLRPGGVLAVVTFHSLEDRMVKRFFTARAAGRPLSRHLPQAETRAAVFTPLTKGAQAAGAAETARNPRARSAKLRAGARTDAPPQAEDFRLFALPDLPVLKSLPLAAERGGEL